MPPAVVPLAERVAVLEQQAETHDRDLGQLRKALEDLNSTLRETNASLMKLQLTNAFLSGQRKGVYVVLCVSSSALGGGLAFLAEYFFRGHAGG